MEAVVNAPLFAVAAAPSGDKDTAGLARGQTLRGLLVVCAFVMPCLLWGESAIHVLLWMLLYALICSTVFAYATNIGTTQRRMHAGLDMNGG
eukprot:CAMPEP_0172158144 /NCGR_PEP_ID=MMETSP1050-20130122/4207_1 /TAXON_ID=233186 /ORGANISM="Cryptomonas curvata, Strain CCAP979/52" /LENGTH=91 /DNA_ID=CAMNT_0012827499 /DNA_START=430 /DNA_END=701 /DNA_ORIENTATION=+